MTSWWRYWIPADVIGEFSVPPGSDSSPFITRANVKSRKVWLVLGRETVAIL